MSAPLLVWRAPVAAEGVYRLAGDRLVPIEPFAEVGTETVRESNEPVRYPMLKPVQVPLVDSGEWLVVTGAAHVDRLRIRPLIPDADVRIFQGDVRIDDHCYIGVRFRSDTKVEPVDVRVREARESRVSDGERAIRYVAWDAVPAGRYAVLGDLDPQTRVVDFGRTQPAAAAGP